MASVRITEFTDPGCPWGWSAEPARRRLAWLYGESLQWELRMVGLSAAPEDNAAKGLTPDVIARAFATIAREHGMPIDARERARTAATLPACRAVVAARVHAPGRERPLLRRLRVRGFSGDLLDDPRTIAGAAREAGLDPDALAAWTEGADVARALDEDLAAARSPSQAALALDHKLAAWDGGRRYTCPSYELEALEGPAAGMRLSVPGFQPVAAYEAAVANLAPAAGRREDPRGVEEVLAWAGEPLATREVAVVCGIEHREARERLGRVADEEHVGADGFWSLAD
jgi:predicted DsbA family dithiol-disulfide isomerase